jgi:hypothetical protein
MKATTLLVACALLSLNFKTIAVNKTFNLTQLLSNPNFTVAVSSNGKYNGKSVLLTIESKNSSDIALQIPEGTLFLPANESEQTLVAPRKQEMIVYKNKPNNFLVYGFCTEASDRCPTEYDDFTVAMNKNEQLTQLLNFFKSNQGIQKNTIQEAIWCITDNESISNIYSENEELNKKLKKRLSEITGKKIPWHTNKRELSTDDRGFVVANPTEVLGTVTFSTTEKTAIKSKVINEEGEVVFPNSNDLIIPKAISDINLEFKVRVRGWEKGKYYVIYYTAKGKTILKKEFIV